MKQIFSSAKSEVIENVTKYLSIYMKDFGIDSNKELAHFLSQAGHETGGFKKSSVTEGLYYTTEERLKQIYPSKYKGEEAKKASDYLKNSEKLANLVYGGQYGNSNEASGDGYKYRGRGLFQLTFKDNYESFDNYMKKNYRDTSDFVEHPDLVGNDIRYSVLSAFWFFETRVLKHVDIANATVRDVTRKINPGMAGIEDRTTIYNRASKILQ